MKGTSAGHPYIWWSRSWAWFIIKILIYHLFSWWNPHWNHRRNHGVSPIPEIMLQSWWFSQVARSSFLFSRSLVISPFCIVWSQNSKLHSFIPWLSNPMVVVIVIFQDFHPLPCFQCLSRLRAVSLCSSLPELFELWDAGASSAMRCRALEATELRCRPPMRDPWELGIIQPILILKKKKSYLTQNWRHILIYHGFNGSELWFKIEDVKSIMNLEYHVFQMGFAGLDIVYAVQSPYWCFSMYSIYVSWRFNGLFTSFLMGPWNGATSSMPHFQILGLYPHFMVMWKENHLGSMPHFQI